MLSSSSVFSFTPPPLHEEHHDKVVLPSVKTPTDRIHFPFRPPISSCCLHSIGSSSTTASTVNSCASLEVVAFLPNSAQQDTKAQQEEMERPPSSALPSSTPTHEEEEEVSLEQREKWIASFLFRVFCEVVLSRPITYAQPPTSCSLSTSTEDHRDSKHANKGSTSNERLCDGFSYFLDLLNASPTTTTTTTETLSSSSFGSSAPFLVQPTENTGGTLLPSSPPSAVSPFHKKRESNLCYFLHQLLLSLLFADEWQLAEALTEAVWQELLAASSSTNPTWSSSSTHIHGRSHAPTSTATPFSSCTGPPDRTRTPSMSSTTMIDDPAMMLAMLHVWAMPSEEKEGETETEEMPKDFTGAVASTTTTELTPRASSPILPSSSSFTISPISFSQHNTTYLKSIVQRVAPLMVKETRFFLCWYFVTRKKTWNDSTRAGREAWELTMRRPLTQRISSPPPPPCPAVPSSPPTLTTTLPFLLSGTTGAIPSNLPPTPPSTFEKAWETLEGSLTTRHAEDALQAPAPLPTEIEKEKRGEEHQGRPHEKGNRFVSDAMKIPWKSIWPFIQRRTSTPCRCAIEQRVGSLSSSPPPRRCETETEHQASTTKTGDPFLTTSVLTRPTWPPLLSLFTVDTFSLWRSTVDPTNTYVPCSLQGADEKPENEAKRKDQIMKVDGAHWRFDSSRGRGEIHRTPFTSVPFSPSPPLPHPHYGCSYFLGCPLLDGLLASHSASPFLTADPRCALLLSPSTTSTTTRATNTMEPSLPPDQADPEILRNRNLVQVGGVARAGCITEVFGEAGTGKTQWVLQLLCMEAARHAVRAAVWRVGEEQFQRINQKKKKKRAMETSSSLYDLLKVHPGRGEKGDGEDSEEKAEEEVEEEVVGEVFQGNGWKKELERWERVVFHSLPPLPPFGTEDEEMEGAFSSIFSPPSPPPPPVRKMTMLKPHRQVDTAPHENQPPNLAPEEEKHFSSTTPPPFSTPAATSFTREAPPSPRSTAGPPHSPDRREDPLLVYLAAEEVPVPRLAQLARGAMEKMLSLYFDDPVDRILGVKRGREAVPLAWNLSTAPLSSSSSPSSATHSREVCGNENLEADARRRAEYSHPLSSTSFGTPPREWNGGGHSGKLAFPPPSPLFTQGWLPFSFVSRWKRRVQQMVTPSEVLARILIYRLRDGLQEVKSLLAMDPVEDDDMEAGVKDEEEEKEEGQVASRVSQRGPLIALLHATQRRRRNGTHGGGGGVVVLDSIAAAAQQSTLAATEADAARTRLSTFSSSREIPLRRVHEEDEDDDEEEEQDPHDDDSVVRRPSFRDRRTQQGEDLSRSRPPRTAPSTSTSNASLLRAIGVLLRRMSWEFGVAVVVTNQVRAVFSSSTSIVPTATGPGGWSEHERRRVDGKKAHEPAPDGSGSTFASPEKQKSTATTSCTSFSPELPLCSLRLPPLPPGVSSPTITTTPLGLTWASIPHVRLRLYRSRYAGTAPFTFTTPPPPVPPTTTWTPSSSPRTMMTLRGGQEGIRRPTETVLPACHALSNESTRERMSLSSLLPPTTHDDRWVQVWHSAYLPRDTIVPFRITAKGVEGIL